MITKLKHYLRSLMINDNKPSLESYSFTDDTLFALYHDKYDFIYDAISDGQYLYALLGNNLEDSIYLVRYDLPKPTNSSWADEISSLNSIKGSQRILMPHKWHLKIPYRYIRYIDLDLKKKEVIIYLDQPQESNLQLSYGWKLKIKHIGFCSVDFNQLNKFPITPSISEEKYLKEILNTPLYNRNLFVFFASKAHYLNHWLKEATEFHQLLKKSGINKYSYNGFHFVLQKKNVQEVFCQSFVSLKE